MGLSTHESLPGMPRKDEIEYLEKWLTSRPIRPESIAKIKEHVGKVFVSQEIEISQERLDNFLKATGDINPFHFDKRKTIKSVLAGKTGGQVVAPGFLTLSICADEKVLWEALKINEPHEILSLNLNDISYESPVPVGAKVIYEYCLESSEDKIMRRRPSNEVVWNIKAYVLENGKKTLCMKAKWKVVYVSIPVEN